MFSFFYRSSCRPRLFLHASKGQENQQCITTTSILTKPSRTATTTKIPVQLQRKKKPPSTHSLPIPAQPSVSTRQSKNHRKTITQPLIFQQCAGLRLKDGKPCQRRVPVDPKHVSATTLAYCHDHRPLVTDTSHTPLPVDISPYLTSSSMESKRTIESSPIYDCWSLWIGKHIGPRKRMQIQQEMIKPISKKDEAGYLYAYHLTQGPRVSTHHYCYFKIGRSINPTRRVLQVIQKCNYQPKLLDIIPGKRRTAKQYHQDKTILQTGDYDGRMLKCPISHRVERLIHMELAALYPSTGGFKCQGCGTTHREWFRVKRPMVQVQDADAGGEKWRRMTDQEVWMNNIRPVMLHWIQYGAAASALLQAFGSHSSSLDQDLD